MCGVERRSTFSVFRYHLCQSVYTYILFLSKDGKGMIEDM